MAIEGLGESLLSRTKQRNDELYERNKQDALELGLINAGANLVNNTLQSKAKDFLSSEKVMAQKAKYRAALSRAEEVSSLNEKIAESGKSPEQYFMDSKYLPAMQEEYKAEYGEEHVPESYMPKLRDAARQFAEEEANQVREATRVAEAMPDVETGMKNFDSVVMPPTTIGGELMQRISGIFSGKSQDEFQQEALEDAKSLNLMQNEETKKAFNKIRSNSGLDEAVKFVKNLDTSGFTKNESVNVDVELHSDGEGGLNVSEIRQIEDSDGNVVDTQVNNRNYTPERIKEQERAEVETSVMESVDLVRISEEVLRPEAHAKLTQELNDSGLNLYNLPDYESFKRAAAVVNDMTANPDNLRNDLRDENISNNLGEMISASDFILEEIFVEGQRQAEEEGREYGMEQALQDQFDAARRLSEAMTPEAERTQSTYEPVDYEDYINQ